MNRSWGNWVQSLSSEFSIVILVPQHKFNPLISFGAIQKHCYLCTCRRNDIKIRHWYRIFLYIHPLDWCIWRYCIQYTFCAVANYGAWSLLRRQWTIILILCMGNLAYIKLMRSQKTLFIDDSTILFQFLKQRWCPKNLISSPQRTKDDKSPLKASIVGSTLKVIYPFLDFLKELDSESDFEIEFSFHLGSTS